MNSKGRKKSTQNMVIGTRKTSKFEKIISTSSESFPEKKISYIRNQYKIKHHLILSENNQLRARISELMIENVALKMKKE